jgi:hypothetical protein
MFWLTIFMVVCYLVIWRQLITESPVACSRLILTSHLVAVGITVGMVFVCVIAKSVFQVRVIAGNITIFDRSMAVIFCILTFSFLIGCVLVSRKGRK